MDPQPSQMPSLSSQTLILPPLPERMPSYHPSTHNTRTPGSRDPRKARVSGHRSPQSPARRSPTTDPAQPPSPPPHCHTPTPACSSSHRAGSTHCRALALAVFSARGVWAQTIPGVLSFTCGPSQPLPPLRTQSPLTTPHAAPQCPKLYQKVPQAVIHSVHCGLGADPHQACQKYTQSLMRVVR